MNETVNLNDVYKDHYKPYYDPFQIDPNNPNDPWVLTVDLIIKIAIGTLWVTLIYVAVRSTYMIVRLIRNQIKYDEIKKKWIEEIKLYEDQQVIKETNEQYRKKLLQYEDRFDQYDFKDPKALYRYAFLLLIVVFLTSIWMTIEYMRSCLTYGIASGIFLLLSYQIYDSIVKPLKEKINHRLEIRRLNEQMKNQKKKEE